jgi:hypothetical protein
MKRRQLQAELRRRIRRAQQLQTGFRTRDLRLAGVYEEVERARADAERDRAA